MSRILSGRKLAAVLILGVVLLLIAAWMNGRSLTRFLDRFFTTHERSLPATRFAATEGEAGTYHGGALQIDDQELSNAGLDFFAFPIAFQTNAVGELVLTSNGKSFVLGPLLSNQPGMNGVPVLRFAPGTGDTVRFDIDHSVLGWPAPVRFNFMAGTPPASWRRAIYYRLRWQKPDGSRLEMVWTYDQDFSSPEGWHEVWTRGGTGGLMRLTIQP